MLLNYIALEALKTCRMPMARVLISGVVMAKFNPDTATKRSLDLNTQVMELINMAYVAAESTGIGPANELIVGPTPWHAAGSTNVVPAGAVAGSMGSRCGSVNAACISRNSFSWRGSQLGSGSRV